MNKGDVKMNEILKMCFGIEDDTDIRLQLLEIKVQRLIDNGFTEKEAIEILINNIEMVYDDSIIDTKEDTVYYHSRLQIQSKPGGFDPRTGEVINNPYYLEMRERYTMYELLEYYYDKLNIPIEFRDDKRDVGAMNHLISTYKSFTIIQPVDFILYMIDYCVSTKTRISNPLDLKNIAQQTYELLENMIPCTKLELRRREDNIVCAK